MNDNQSIKYQIDQLQRKFTVLMNQSVYYSYLATESLQSARELEDKISVLEEKLRLRNEEIGK